MFAGHGPPWPGWLHPGAGSEDKAPLESGGDTGAVCMPAVGSGDGCSACVSVCVCVCVFVSHSAMCDSFLTVDFQASLSMEFSRQDYWSG